MADWKGSAIENPILAAAFTPRFHSTVEREEYEREQDLLARERKVWLRVEADARALWAVRVLDAWADRRAEWAEWSYAQRGVRGIRLEACYRGAERIFAASDYGSMAAARIAAAEAVWFELPADVRAELGARP